MQIPPHSDRTGKKNGSKLIRQMLMRTPNWRDPNRRPASIPTAAAAGRDRVVDALMSGHTTMLRKDDLFYICNLWCVGRSSTKYLLLEVPCAEGAAAPAVPSGLSSHLPRAPLICRRGRSRARLSLSPAAATARKLRSCVWQRKEAPPIVDPVGLQGARGEFWRQERPPVARAGYAPVPAAAGSAAGGGGLLQPFLGNHRGGGGDRSGAIGAIMERTGITSDGTDSHLFVRASREASHEARQTVCLSRKMAFLTDCARSRLRPPLQIAAVRFNVVPRLRGITQHCQEILMVSRGRGLLHVFAAGPSHLCCACSVRDGCARLRRRRRKAQGPSASASAGSG